jgi:anti-anti-sigma factor
VADATIEPSQSGGTAIIGIAGSIDHTNAESFSDELAGPLDAGFAAGQPVIFNLAGLEYISSAGLRVLMIASRTAKEKEGRLMVAGWSETIKEIFTISRFNLIFECFDTLAEAEAKLAEG